VGGGISKEAGDAAELTRVPEPGAQSMLAAFVVEVRKGQGANW